MKIIYDKNVFTLKPFFNKIKIKAIRDKKVLFHSLIGREMFSFMAMKITSDHVEHIH